MTAGFDLGLAGVPALVTGAASGIGRATALLLAENGAFVAIIDKNADAARAVADQINAAEDAQSRSSPTPARRPT